MSGCWHAYSVRPAPVWVQFLAAASRMMLCFAVISLGEVSPARSSAAASQPTQPDQPAPAPPSPLRIALSATVDRTNPTIIDPVTLTLELRIPARDPATNQPLAAHPVLSPDPTPDQPLGDLLVSSVRRDPPRLEDHHLVHLWIVTLEPQLPGSARIPAIGVTLAPEPPPSATTLSAPSPAATSLRSPFAMTASDPIDLTVTSVLEAAPDFVPGQVRPPLDATPERARSTNPGWLLPSAISFLGGALAVVGFLSVRSTPRRRVRRAFAPLHTLARAIVNQRQPTDDPNRALAAADLIRGAAALSLGPAARAATPDELVALLGPSTRSATIPQPPASPTSVTTLLTWSDAHRYGGLTTPPPPFPDLPALIRNLERSALNNLDQSPGARPA